MPRYAFTIEGSAADGQSWSTSGEVQTLQQGDFPSALEDAQRQSFMQLTEGKAVYGKPGVGCRGPYKIDKFLVERKLDS